MENKKENGGSIRIIIAFIAIVVIFAYFGINFRDLVAHAKEFFVLHPQIQNFFQFFLNFTQSAWSEYILPGLLWLGDKIASIVHMFTRAS